EHYVRNPDIALGLPPFERYESVAGAGALPHFERFLSARLWSDRTDHAGLPTHGVNAATTGWHGHRQATKTVFTARRDGLQPDWTAAAVGGDTLPDDPHRGRHGRAW